MANTEGYLSTKRFTKLECADFCEHCSADDLSKAVGYYYERDSFGLVSQYIVCEPCRLANEEAHGNQPTNCHDCGKTVLIKDTIEWKSYDFVMEVYEEPIEICTECQCGEKHQKRIKDHKEGEAYLLRQEQEEREAEEDLPDEDDEPFDD